MDKIFNASLIASTVRMMIPLVLVGLGGAISGKAGIINFALEGYMLVGAFAGAVGSYLFGDPMIGLLLAIIAGALSGLFMSVFVAVFKGAHVVISVGFNFVASGLTALLLSSMFGTSGVSPRVDKLTLYKFPIIGQQTVVFVIAIIAVPLVSILLWKSVFGLRLRAVGDNPAAADSVGISVTKYQIIALVIAGILAGIAGAELSIGQIAYFGKDMTGGKGFLGVACARIGGYNPIVVFIMAGVIGFLDAIQMRLSGLLKLPGQLLLTIPYLATILATLGFRKFRAPRALGVQYEREKNK